MPEKAYNKDKKVKIFYLIKRRNEDGFIEVIKKYIHPLDKSLSAYVRDLSAKEKLANQQVQDDSTLLAIINRRDVNNTMFLEYKRRGLSVQTYNINGVDFYDDSSSEIKLTLSLIQNEITFDKVEGTEWN